jgi:hypothetical protein
MNTFTEFGVRFSYVIRRYKFETETDVMIKKKPIAESETRGKETKSNLE